jgi:pyruvate dehydrogenase E1 component alpha subunit
MRMMGHAIHDPADYVPRELLEAWEKRNPIELYERKLLEEGVADAAEIDEIKHRCEVEITEAIDFAEKSPFPDPATVMDGIYAP